MTRADKLVHVSETVLPPGETLQEVLEERAMTQADLALRTGLSSKHINQIIKGQAGISAETALLLERATGVHAFVWAKLDSAYQVAKSRETETERLRADLDWLNGIPVRELIKRGRIRALDDSVEMVREVCNFFGVANHAAWDSLWEKPTAYRRSRAFTSDPGAVAAWLRIGEIEASEITCAPYDKAGLQSRLPALRALTSIDSPDIWWPELQRLLSEVGVAVVVEREIAGARVVGATRWLTPNKALIQLSLRHRWSDIFWFTLFHEIGHLILHSKKDVFINDRGPHSGAEAEADAYAAALLIPPSADARLSQMQTEADVVAFAKEIGIGPDIVVGRLQFEERWPYSKGVSLKRRFVPVEK